MSAALLATLLVSAGPARFALVIGYNAPLQADVPALRYADDDAVAMAELLAQTGAEVHLLVDMDEDTRAMRPDVVAEPPTWAEVERHFAAINDAMSKRHDLGGASELLLFYSGHGDIQGDEGVVALADGVLSRTRLQGLLRRSVARRNHVIVDACRSYLLVQARGPGGERTPFTGPFDDGLGTTGFVVSTSSDQESHEWERYGAGVFSHEVRSALRGGADLDDDSAITYADSAFLATANRAIPNPALRPSFSVRPPGGLETPLLEWPAMPSGVVVDVADGPLFVEDRLGERLADVHSVGQVRVRLPEGRPIFVHRRGDGLERQLDGEGWVRLSEVPAGPPRIAPKGAQHRAFEALFAEAFGPNDVVAFRDDQVPPRTVASVASGPGAERPAWLLPAAATAGVTLLVGSVAATIAAMEQRNLPPGASQREVHARNEVILGLNVGAVAGYVAAALVGTASLWLAAPWDSAEAE